MKKAQVPAPLDPAAAFPDPNTEPDDAALAAALGAAFTPVATILAQLRANCPAVTSAWQYSKQAGWYRLALLKKRRLFYLVPKRGGFRLMLILGGKALADLAAGPHARAVAKLLQSAKRYPEGTAFEFTAATCDPSLVAALLAAKLAH